MTDESRRILLPSDLCLSQGGGLHVMYCNLFKCLAAAGDAVTEVTAKVPDWREFDAEEQSPRFRSRRRFQPLRDRGWRQIPRMLGPVLYAFWCVLCTRSRVLHCGDLLERFGMDFLEANAEGKPVIGGRSGGKAEAIVEGEAGFLVDPDDERGLQYALRRLLVDDGLRHRMGERGLARMRQEFDRDSRAAALRQIGPDILAKRRRRSRRV